MIVEQPGLQIKIKNDAFNNELELYNKSLKIHRNIIQGLLLTVKKTVEA